MGAANGAGTVACRPRSSAFEDTWPSAHQLQWGIAECVYHELLGVSFPDMSQPSDPSTWYRHRGTYNAVFEDGFEFEVVVEMDGGQLFITVPD